MPNVVSKQRRPKIYVCAYEQDGHGIHYSSYFFQVSVHLIGNCKQIVSKRMTSAFIFRFILAWNLTAQHAGWKIQQTIFCKFFLILSEHRRWLFMKCQSLFSGKNKKKKITSLSSAEFAQSDTGLGMQIQSNLNGSNIFGTMEIRSRHG